MNREAQEKLKFDRRLHVRPGWLSEAELASECESLEDVSHKVWVEEPTEAPADHVGTGPPGAPSFEQ